MTETGTSLAFDRVAHEYDRTRGGLERGAAAAEAVLPWLPADGAVLEVGIGTGLVAAPLTEGGRTVFGVDLSLPMLARAQERLPGRVVAGDSARLPFASGSVAAVVMIHVLHVVGDVATTLTEATRVLRPGGRILTSVHPDEPPDTNDVSSVLKALVEQFEMEERIRSRGEAGITDTARGCGLTVVDRVTYDPDHLPLTPAQAIERLQTRTWSWIWRVDEAEFVRAVGPAIEQLRALPDQDRPRRENRPIPILALERA
jgi:SAM-dependent methyltransferase